MKSGFSGFAPEAMKFLKALKRNNDREWFQPRKETYENQWRKPMIELVAALGREMESFASAYVSDPAKAVLRIYRDTRFSKDKTPYKTHVAAGLRARGLSKNGSAQFYFHINSEEIVVAGGVYMPSPDELRALRTHLAANHPAFQKLIRAPKLVELMGELQGATLSRPPKGFSPDHPAASLLRRKQFHFATTLDPGIALTPRLFPELLARIRTMTPAIEFLNAPLRGLAKADGSRFLR